MRHPLNDSRESKKRNKGDEIIDKEEWIGFSSRWEGGEVIVCWKPAGKGILWIFS